MAESKKRSTLEKLGITFLIFIAFGGIYAISMIITGAFEAKTASKAAQAQFGNFTSDICQLHWQNAYSQLDPAFQSQNTLSDFQTKLLPGFRPGLHLIRCGGTMWHSAREQDGNWRAEFSQYLIGTENYGVRHRVILHSSSTGWSVLSVSDLKD